MDCTILILLLPLAGFLFLGLAGMKLRPAVAGAVGTALMARLPLPAEGEDVPVLQALEDVAVRPTSQQTLVFLGKDFSLEHTAEEAQDCIQLFSRIDIWVLKRRGNKRWRVVHTE